MVDDELLLTAVHDTAIRRLQHAYADVINRRAWPELQGLFLPEAAVVIDTRKGEPLQLLGGRALGEFIGTSVTRFSFFEFEILNAHIVFPEGAAAGSAVSRLYMCEHRLDESSGRWTNAFGLYHDRYHFDGARWWFAQRAYHSLARNAPELEVFPFPDPPPIEVPGAGHHS